MPVLNNFFDVWLSMVIIVVIYLEMTSFVFVCVFCFILKKKYPSYLKYKKNMIKSNDLSLKPKCLNVACSYIYAREPSVYFM